VKVDGDALGCKGFIQVDFRVGGGVEEIVYVAETRGFAAATGVNIVLEEITLVLLLFLCPRLHDRLSKLQGISRNHVFMVAFA
jgi:hypothetical protein